MVTDDGKKTLLALTPEQLSELLRHCGSYAATPDAVRRMISEGAPTNGDGTVNFAEFTGYLVNRLLHGKSN